MFRQALDEDTPLLLEFSTYDDVHGLSLNVLKKIPDIDDEELD